jgi:hypothetical protein
MVMAVCQYIFALVNGKKEAFDAMGRLAALRFEQARAIAVQPRRHAVPAKSTLERADKRLG